MPAASPFPELETVQAIVRNSHIVYTSGKHGSSYVNKDAVYPHTDLTSRLCLKMAEPFRKTDITAVIAPAIGGVILAQWVAHHLSALQKKEVLAVYAEPTAEKKFVIKRGYDALIRNQPVLVVEDVLTTGGSVRSVLDAIALVPARVAGVSAFCNRGGITSQSLGIAAPFHALFEIPMETWDSSECPLCKSGVPINTQLGKGRDFLNQQKSK